MELHVFLLKGCPYSESLAKVLSDFPQVKQEWITRDQTLYQKYKKKYHHPTYPIVVLRTKKSVRTIGGYDDFMSYLE